MSQNPHGDPIQPNQPQYVDPQAAPAGPSAAQPVGQPVTGATTEGSTAVATKKKSPVVPIVAGVAALALIGGGVAFGSKLFAGAGDAQPTAFVPANALLYMSADLNPPAAQKVAAAQYLTKFPAIKNQGISDQSDFKKVVFDAMAKSNDKLKAYNYDTDIKPWLGDRFAIAGMPSADGKESDPLFVFQVTDEAKAKAAIDKGVADGVLKNAECQVQKKYAVCAETGKLNGLFVTDAAKSIESNKTFTDDVAAVTGDAVGTFWMDLSQTKLLQDITDTESAKLPENVEGRVAAKLRFDGGTAAELAGVSRGVKGAVATGVAAGTDVAKLPADTIAAVSMNGFGKMLETNWATPEKQIGAEQIKQAETQLGISLPGDLVKLLGSHSTLAFGGINGTQQMPDIALLTDGDKTVADKLSGNLNGMLQVSQGAERTILTPSSTYATKVASGGLGDAAAFKAAVPDAAKGDAVVYFDVAKVLELAGTASMTAEQRENIAPLQAVGASGNLADGSGTFKYRVTTK